MSRYVLSPAAVFDLEDIWDYIASDNMDAADRWIARLFDAFEQLAEMPSVGHRRDDLTDYPVLFWTVGAYPVIYRARHDQVVEIVGVTQGARNIPVFLRGRLN